MKILISSHAFSPSIGGIETVSELLAAEFVQLGHEIKVVTQTPGPDDEEAQYPVLRQSSGKELRKAIRWCDLFWQNNLSLRTLWPALLLRKPVVVTHQGSYCRAPSGLDLVQRLKHLAVRLTTSVAISQAVAECFKVRSIVIHNPYDARNFRFDPDQPERSNELVFLGRLVSEKGTDLLLEALSILRDRALRPALTIIGSGPELSALQTMAAGLGLSEQVTFAGAKRGSELVTLLQQHKIMVVPSRYDEPFGVVALEGIAAGCVVVGSSGGGLPEAIGPSGVTFRNGDGDALAGAIESLLSNPERCEALRASAARHLAQFHPRAIAESYLKLFQDKLL